MREQLDGRIERRSPHAALQLPHAGDRAADELAGDVGARQAALRMIDDVADARLVVVIGREPVREAVAEDLLQLGVAGEPEVLGEADHG